MLLNYLYQNFFEEHQFAAVVGTTIDELSTLTRTRLFPSPSYVYSSKAHSVSFVSVIDDDQVYRFHLRGHVDWYRDVMQLGLTTEGRARAHFVSRYEQAKSAFLSSPIGKELRAEAPDVASQFDQEHIDATWNHFLNGVYGVCTRDGRPESVFLKQVGVMFIEQMIANGPGALSRPKTDLLRRTVDFLDEVESDFAPHERQRASRQRCIEDVRTRFLGGKAA